jgi:hypothetical protein
MVRRLKLLISLAFLVSLVLRPASIADAQACAAGELSSPALNIVDFGFTDTDNFRDTNDDSRSGWFVFKRNSQEEMKTSPMGAYLYGTADTFADPVKSYHETRYNQLKAWGGSFNEESQEWSGANELKTFPQFGDESSAYQRTSDWEENMVETMVVMRKGCRVGFFTLATMSRFDPTAKAERYARIMEIRLSQ